MVMTTGFLRVCAPSVLLLLTMTTLVQQADGTTDSSAAADVDVAMACETELAACREAETCTSCINDLDEEKADVNVCGEALGFYDVPTNSTVESDADTCDEIHAVACCLDEVTEDEQCVENPAFESYWLCISAAHGCIEDEIDCTEINEELDELAEEDSGATAAASVGIIASTAAAFAGVTCASIVLQLL